MKKEIWKDIKGYEGCYQISNHGGKIKSISRIITRNSNICKLKERILKPILGNKGYLQVSLSKNDKVKNYRVAILVLSAFKKRPSKIHQCNHKDGNKLNNNLENLEWVTSSENTIHAFRNGLYKGKMPSNKEIKEIQKIYNQGEVSQGKLAKRYGVSRVTVWRIIHNKVAKRDF